MKEINLQISSSFLRRDIHFWKLNLSHVFLDIFLQNYKNKSGPNFKFNSWNLHSSLTKNLSQRRENKTISLWSDGFQVGSLNASFFIHNRCFRISESPLVSSQSVRFLPLESKKIFRIHRIFLNFCAWVARYRQNRIRIKPAKICDPQTDKHWSRFFVLG